VRSASSAARALLGVSLALGSPAALAAGGDQPVIELPEDEGPAGRFAVRSDPLTLVDERVASITHSVVLGGYGEYQFFAPEGEDSFFQHQRYILFVYSRISDRISTATEVEFEFGGTPRKADGALTTGEVLLEYSVVDFRLADWLTLRTGIVLMPFAFNLRHDSPTRDLTERPLAMTTLVPTTWFEIGAGLVGGFELGDHRLHYETYVVNGLDARINDGLALRGARGSLGEDNNNDKAVVGRLSWSPALGKELGLVGYTGEYNRSGGRVNLLAVDTTLRFGRLELLFEGATAFIDPGFVEGFSAASPANTRKPVPERMSGYYAQANYHVPVGWPRSDESHLTFVLRYEELDSDQAAENENDVSRVTFGLNYRPVEAYVIKTDLQAQTLGPRGLLWAAQGDLDEDEGWWFSERPELTFATSVAMMF
jgi:hypothetical protein